MNWRKESNGIHIILISLMVLLFLSGGCTKRNIWSSGDEGIDETAPENIPYFADDLNDILIPNELQWDRQDSISIRTESFKGGLLKFSGRVEVNSLTEFFINTMIKNKWKMVGSAKYKNVLLAFTKPQKTAMITISETASTTTVQIYVTDDITSRKDVSPFADETLR